MDTETRPVWRALLPYLWPHRGALATAVALNLAAAAVGLVIPLAARRLVDDLSTGRPLGAAVAVLVLSALANAVTSGAGSYLLQRCAETFVLGVRRALVSRLTRLRLGVLDSVEPGDLAARVTADTPLLRELVTASLAGTFAGLLTVSGVVTMMALMDPVLLGVSALTLALAGALIGLATTRINRSAVRAQRALGAVGAGLERMFGAFRTVKACGAEEREEARLRGALRQLWRDSVRAGGWSGVAATTVELAVQAAFLVVLAVGGARVASGTITVGTLVAFLLYVFMLAPPAGQVVHGVVRYQTGSAGARRIMEAIALPTEPTGPEPAGPEPTGPAPPATRGAAVVFDDVHFRYGSGSRQVHRGITFRIPPVGTTAIVGASGEGKTTLFSLIQRFHDPDRGRVLVEGTDVRNWPLRRLRETIGYVEQDAVGLSGTVRENLLYGVRHADEADVRSVLALVRLDETVARLPHHLDTPIGHRGARLSGGERQRLAIARALLRRPRLLLLDEVTAHLDAVNERALRGTIDDVARSTTVLIITHRLSTAVSADRIVVLGDGRVRAVGTHADLLRTDRFYAGLATTQLVTGRPYASDRTQPSVS